MDPQGALHDHGRRTWGQPSVPSFPCICGATHRRPKERKPETLPSSNSPAERSSLSEVRGVELWGELGVAGGNDSLSFVAGSSW